MQLVIGASALSLGLMLATFMGGLCAGSLLLPRFVPPDRHPLGVYARLEVGVALFGVLVLFLVPVLGNVYVASVGRGFLGLLLRGLLAAICLLPPTILMGATLPAVARWVETTPQGVAWLGFFYGGNIAGAVGGALLAGFYLLRLYDMATATYVAVAINLTVAGIAWLLVRRTPHAAPAARGVEAIPPLSGGWPTYVVLGLSGAAALGAEVAWTRVLSLLLGGTVYTFSLITAAFLSGLGVGSSGGAWLARTSKRPGAALALAQGAAVVSIAWAAMLLNREFPYWPIDPALAPGPWFNFQIDLLRALLTVFPAACCWGATFPLGLATLATADADQGRVVGRAYGANTIGAIVGALAFSLLIIPALGTHGAQQVMIALSCLAAVVMLVWTPATEPVMKPARRARALAGTVAVTVLAISSVAPIPADLVAYGRQIATFKGARFLYEAEGLNSSIAVSEQEGGVRNFHVSGKVEASTEVHDMRLQRLLGHMSALMHPEPKTVLVVGFGAGVTAGSFVLHPSVQRIVICEIEPLIPRMIAPFFSKENYDVVHDPRVEIVYDDARHYILTTREKFDVITSDPIHPWVKGAASLYTKDYFDLVKAHLNPGGVVTQWVPLYQSSEEVIKSEVATFFETFPNGTIWSNQFANGGGYDVVMLAKAGPLVIDPAALQARLDRPDHARVAAALTEVEFPGVKGLMAAYGGRAKDLRPWLADAQINRDSDLRLQYLAGMANNVYDNRIYEDMLAYWRFPADMFSGPPDSIERLRAEMAPGQPAEGPPPPIP